MNSSYISSQADIVPSHFTHFIDPDTHIQRRPNLLRQHDQWVLSNQYPVGWSFFSHKNIEFMTTKLSQVYSSIDLAFLAPFMIRVYQRLGALMDDDPSPDIQKVNRCVSVLNEELESLVERDQRIYRLGQREANNYHKGQFMRPYTNPMYVLTNRVLKRKTHVINPASDTIADIGYFDPAATNVVSNATAYIPRVVDSVKEYS